MNTPKIFPYHPRVLRHRRKHRGKLDFSDATAMAIGGMIGGGIFSVLGTTVAIAGHMAFLCFLVGGVIALLTAFSYAKLSMQAGRSGGPFLYLARAGYPELGASSTWLLLFGYVIALAVYAFSFGHYTASVLNLGWFWPQIFSTIVMFAFLAINLRGVAASALTEDLIVFIKIFILVAITLVGVWHFSPSRFTPFDTTGVSSIFLGATSIFVAYEGFELLTYDYDDIQKPRKNVKRALFTSVVLVTLIYIIVTIGSQMLVSDGTIIAEKEVAFISVGQAAFGVVGRWAATFAAVLATCSAINATLFSSARQIHDVAAEGELPKSLAKTVNGMPAEAIIALTILGTGFALLPNVLTLLTFGSFVFLCVFALVNYLAHRTATKLFEKIITAIAALSCLSAILVLLVQLWRHDQTSLLLIGICLPILGVARVLFKRFNRHGQYQEQS